jgi:hypothetical protein
MELTDYEIQNLGEHFDVRLAADGGEKRGKVFLLRKKRNADPAAASAALEPFRRDPDFQVREVLHDADAGTKVTELRSLCGERCYRVTALSSPVF